MGLIIIIINTFWNALGLSNRGTMFKVIEVGVLAVSGGAGFLVGAYLLKLHELQMLVNMIIRRKPVTEVSA